MTGSLSRTGGLVWTAPLAVEGAGETLEGTIHLLGADGLLKTRFYQAVINGPGARRA